jgi:sugar lactone lactonase YvrE
MVMATPAVKRVVGPHAPFDQIARGLQFSEGPAWDHRMRTFFYTDIVADTICRWKPGVGHEVVMSACFRSSVPKSWLR